MIVLFALYAIVWWFCLLFVVSHVAGEKGYNPLAWGVCGFLFSPLIALLALAALPVREPYEREPFGPLTDLALPVSREDEKHRALRSLGEAR